jgi:hypothetical protein
VPKQFELLVSAINMPLSLELEDELLECEEIDVCLSLDISQDMEPPGVELEVMYCKQTKKVIFWM